MGVRAWPVSIPTSTLPARLMTDPIWRRVADFAVRWADPSSPLYRAVDNVWLEFDVDGAPPVIPIPSVFFGLQPSGQEGARGVAYEPNLDGYITTIETVIQLLSGNELAPRKLEMLSDCFRALSSVEHVFQVGLMLSRGAEARPPVHHDRLCGAHGGISGRSRLAVQRSRRPWRPRADSQSGGSCVPGH